MRARATHNVVSLFEAHTEIVHKGKLAKPTEFGRLVKIQEAEAPTVSTVYVKRALHYGKGDEAAD